MTASSKAYSSARGRRFAITLAVAFAVLGLVAYLRHRTVTFDVLGTLAAVFAVAALVIPSKLEPVERGWMALAHAISKVTTPVFMAIVYFVVLTPIAFIRRLAAGNPLAHKAESGSYWVARKKLDPEAARRRMERQF